MKSSKAAPTISTQDTCGVWLDTVQLKEKSRKKRVARPISKLLKPFTEGRGYSLSVALNFTQTKMEMPKTKQSSISTFFTSHRRVLNKMSTGEDTFSRSLQSFSKPSPTIVVSGVKRDRDAFLEASNWNDSSAWEKMTSIDSQLSHMDSVSKEESAEECPSPQSKRRLSVFDLKPHNLQSIPQPWSQDPLLSWSQFSETDIDPNYQEQDNTKPRSPDTLQSEEDFGSLMAVDGRTSTQKPFKLPHSSHTEDDKENRTLLSLYSPHKHTSCNMGLISLYKEENPKLVSPQKERIHAVNAITEQMSCYSQIWTKPHSPLKITAAATRQQSKGIDEDILSSLFTQDSQGLRVMAHRGLEGRSPLRERRNIFSEKVKMYKSVDDDDDEEEEMLFTQDSQGNVVIKH